MKHQLLNLRPFWALSVMALASCGISSHETARPIEDERFEEIVDPSGVDRETLASSQFRFELRLYMVDDQNELVRLDRPVNSSPTPQTYLDALEAGLTSQEQEQYPDLRTALPDGLDPLDRGSGYQKMETVQLSTSVFESLDENVDRRRLALSQIVCALTEFLAVDRVSLVDTEGVPVRTSNELGEAIAEGGISRTEVGGCEVENVTKPLATSPGPQGPTARFD